MHRNNRLVISIITLFASLFLGCGGCLYAPLILWAIKGDPDSTEMTWRELPRPPEEAKEIIAAGYWTVYIKTQNGKIFSCYRESNLDIECWNEIKNLPDNKEVKKLPDIKKDRGCNGCLFPAPPSNIEVIQNFQIDYFPEGRDLHSTFSYILDKNGTIWQWGIQKFSLGGAPRVFRASLKASIIGQIIGSTLPFLFVVYLWRKELLYPFRKKGSSLQKL